MKLFPWAHATHPQWQMAAGLVLAQLRALMARPQYASNPTLALLYITDHYAEHAQDILDHLSAELPEVTDWSGTVGVGVCASGVEYIDEPAIAAMLCAVGPHEYRVFSGVAPLATGEGMGFEPHAALVHADASTPELGEMIGELAARVGSGYLFGGLASSRRRTVQFAIGGNGNIPGQGAARGVFSGGLSGVGFSGAVPIVSRVTQGCRPVGRERRVTAATENVLLALDGEPALDVLLRERGISLEQPQDAIAVLRATLAGIASPGDQAIGRGGSFGSDVRVRHIIGVDPGRRGVAIADKVETGALVAFCERNVKAARADLMRICAEIREELEPQETSLPVGAALALPDPGADPHPARGIAGAVYVSCAGRGGPHFGGPSAELQLVRHALGDVPLVGFFAGGEIARHHLYGYTGVLTVFTRELNSYRR